MKRFFWIVLFLTLVSTQARCFAATYVVTKTTDDNAACDSGVSCSLRAAVKAANANPGPDTVQLQSGQTYVLSVGPSDSGNGNLLGNQGDLDVTGDVTIEGANSTIDAGNIDRIFHIEKTTSSALSVTLRDLTLTNGKPLGSLAQGGAILVRGAALTLENCRLTNNSANGNNGGAIAANAIATGTLATDAAVTASNTVFENNTGLNGGVLSAANATLHIHHCVLQNNTATRQGGAFFITGKRTLANLGWLAITNNNADEGGGVFVFDGTVQLGNVTIANNHAQKGGAWSQVGGTSTLSMATVSANTSANGPDGIWVRGGQLLVRSSIVAQNGTSDFQREAVGQVNDQGYNIIGVNNTVSSSFVVSTYVGTLASPFDAKLRALADNGGSTWTMLPSVDSVARNHGDPSIPSIVGTPTYYDQRGTGFLRVLEGRIDIGAAEPAFAPVANDQSVSTQEDTAKTITLSATSSNGNTPTYIVVSSPSHGTLSGTAPNLTYTPTANYNGTDSFTFKVNDGTGDSNIATVAITVTAVNDAPVANDQNVSPQEDTAKVITLTGSDVEGSPLTYIIVTQPTHGTLSGTAPNLTYTPASNYHGSDSFTFKVNDGTLDSNTATVSIEVMPVNDAPTGAPQRVETLQNQAVEFTVEGHDVDSAPLTYSIVTPPVLGTLEQLTPGGNVFRYTPKPYATGSFGMFYKVSDGQLESPRYAIKVVVNPDPNLLIANWQSVNTTSNTPVVVTLTSSGGTAPITYSIVNWPAAGTLVKLSNEQYRYTPPLNRSGSFSFSFKASDGGTPPQISNTAHVTVRIP